MVKNDTESVTVSVCCPLVDQILSVVLNLPPEATVGDALQQIKLHPRFIDLDMHDYAVGIFGKVCKLTDSLRNQDRVELTRPLIFDPMESRRRRAQHRKKSLKAR